MNESIPTLYVKTGCPWCKEAREYLDRHGIDYREVNVSEDESARKELENSSGQSKTPTLDWDGDILADFGVEELPDFLHRHDVVLEDS